MEEDMPHALNEVLTDEEAADCKGWTGTYPFFDIGSVCIIERNGDRFFFSSIRHTFLNALRQLGNSR